MLTEEERLFLGTLDDLKKRIEDSDPYEFLGVSGREKGREKGTSLGREKGREKGTSLILLTV